jgi:hypothetical protein
MNFSNDTLSILKNFAGIQPNMVFKSGNTIKTIAEAKNIVAKATIPENIDQDFGIYDLNDFLSSLSLFTTPTMKFSDDNKSLHIEEGKSSMRYFFSDESNLTFPQKDVVMPQTDVSFKLTADTLNSLRKATSLLGISTISVESVGTGIVVRVCDPKNSTSNTYGVEVEGNNGGHNFKFFFEIASLKIINGDYDVAISGKLISHWKHSSLPVEYWIAIEKTSTYEA